MIWKTHAPPRISFFAWEATKEHILTLDNLMKRGFHLVNRCSLCKASPETCRCSLLWCPITYGLWNDIFSLMGIQWVIAGSVKAELLAWESIAAKNKHYRLIPLTIFWVVWKERDNRIFEGLEENFANIKDKSLHLFGSIILGHNLNCLDDFGATVNILTDL